MEAKRGTQLDVALSRLFQPPPYIADSSSYNAAAYLILIDTFSS